MKFKELKQIEPETIRPEMLKIVTVVVGLIVTCVGCTAHFNSYATAVFNRPGATDLCRSIDKCPGYAMPMEVYFVTVTILFLILSVLIPIAGLVLNLGDSNWFKIADRSYHIVGGILITLAGIFMIISAVKLDNFFIPNANEDNRIVNRLTNAFPNLNLDLEVHRTSNPVLDREIDRVRREMKLHYKLFAGALAIVNGIIYFVTVWLTFRPKPTPKPVLRNRKI